MKINSILSKNCNPFNDDTPMNKKTPYSTGIGIRAKMGVMRVDNPMATPIITLVTLCSLMPKNWGFSPGAEPSDSLVNDWIWLIDSTVAATNQGSPKMEHTVMMTAKVSRSK